MAQKQLVTYESDLSGKEIADNDAPTVQFGIDGNNYEIDLTDAEQTKLRETLARYVAAGKRVTNRRTTTRTRVASDASDVRAWAKANGRDVPERGRIPGSVREAFEAAN